MSYEVTDEAYNDYITKFELIRFLKYLHDEGFCLVRYQKVVNDYSYYANYDNFCLLLQEFLKDVGIQAYSFEELGSYSCTQKKIMNLAKKCKVPLRNIYQGTLVFEITNLCGKTKKQALKELNKYRYGISSYIYKNSIIVFIDDLESFSYEDYLPITAAIWDAIKVTRRKEE